LRHAEDFLFHGNKVKLTLTFRGREMAHTEIGYDTIRRAVSELGHMGHPDNEPKLIGRNIIVMMTPVPATKRKLKYTVHDAAAPRSPAEAENADDDADESEAS
jgi:translation initiation factor IF-3